MKMMKWGRRKEEKEGGRERVEERERDHEERNGEEGEREGRKVTWGREGKEGGRERDTFEYPNKYEVPSVSSP